MLLIVNGPQRTSKQFLSTRLINLDGAASQSISATHNKRHLKIEPLCFSSLLHNWWLAGSKIKLQNLNANCRAASKSVIFSYSCTVDSQGTNFLATFKISFLYYVYIEGFTRKATQNLEFLRHFEGKLTLSLLDPSFDWKIYMNSYIYFWIKIELNVRATDF